MALELKIKYKSGETRNITSDLNEEQAQSLIECMKSGDYNMEKATITNITSKNN
jgi:hypothetical protein